MKLISEKIIENFSVQIFTDRPQMKFVEVNQVHGVRIISTGEASISEDADGIYSHQQKFIPMAIKTADCLPIVVIGLNGVAHIHAGWKGVCDDIIAQDEIRAIDPRTIYIGPHIKKCCFEVSADFPGKFQSGENFTQKRDDKIYFALEAYVTARIKKLYPNALIDVAKDCTCCNERYNSYRRNKTNRRNWNILIPKG